MNKDKLAVVLLGNQNSGKTTTIKYFDKKYDENERDKRFCRSGWRHLQLFKEELGALFSLIYFVPASPTETRNSLRNRFEKFKPELLLVAEQLNGKEYSNTIDFLNENNYNIVVFNLTRNKSNNFWSEWNTDNKIEFLDNRATAISKEFKKFIIERIK